MLDIKIKYGWRKYVKEEKVLYDILCVPVYSTEDKKDDYLKQIIINFKKDKELGFYPRILIGHHKIEGRSIESRVGVGFLDNLIIINHIIYADLCELDSNTFDEIKTQTKYPYRSAEILDKVYLSGVALLETVPPVFRFPILVVKPEPESVEMYSVPVERFSRYSVNTRSYSKMPTEPKPDDNILENSSNKEPDKKDADPSKIEKNEEPSLKEVMKALNEILTLLSGHTKKEEKKWAEEPSSAIASYSNSKELDKLIALQDRVDRLTLYSRVDKLDLTQAERKDLEKTLEEFSSHKDRELYLTKFSERNARFQEEPFIETLEKLKIDSANKLSQKEQSIAKKAYRMYNDTLETLRTSDQKKLEEFQSMWPDSKKFIEHVITESAKDENYLDKLSV